MDYINEVKALIPDYAKDVRINLDGVLGRSSLPRQRSRCRRAGSGLRGAGVTPGGDHSQLGRSTRR